jgi:hypothetical protein
VGEIVKPEGISSEATMNELMMLGPKGAGILGKLLTPAEPTVNIPGYGKMPADVGYHYLDKQDKPDRPYKIGQEITRDTDKGKETLRVIGYGKDNLPIMDRVSFQPTKPPKPSETQNKIDYKLWGELRGITHDKDTGEPRDTVSAGAINALNKTARVYGKEIVKIDIPEIVKGIWKAGDKPARSIYIVVDSNQKEIDPEELIKVLVSDYGYNEKDLREVLK